MKANGTIELPGKSVKVSAVLRGEPVGIELREDEAKRLYYGPLLLGTLSPKGKLTRGSRSPRSTLEDPPAHEIKPMEAQN